MQVLTLPQTLAGHQAARRRSRNGQHDNVRELDQGFCTLESP
jgi:hypothetical protein